LLSKETIMATPEQPPREPEAKSGVRPGERPSTDKTRMPNRPIDEEDVFGGAERTHKGEPVSSPNAKP
jgi:hypothetical protein